MAASRSVWSRPNVHIRLGNSSALPCVVFLNCHWQGPAIRVRRVHVAHVAQAHGVLCSEGLAWKCVHRYYRLPSTSTAGPGSSRPWLLRVTNSSSHCWISGSSKWRRRPVVAWHWQEAAGPVMAIQHQPTSTGAECLGCCTRNEYIVASSLDIPSVKRAPAVLW